MALVEVACTRKEATAFLPGVFQGTYIDTQHTRLEKLIEHIKNNYTSLDEQRAQLDEGIAQADRGDVIDGDEAFDRLASRFDFKRL